MTTRRSDNSDEAEAAQAAFVRDALARKPAPARAAPAQRRADITAALDAADTFAALMQGKIKALSGRERGLAAELRRAVQLARTHLTGGAP